MIKPTHNIFQIVEDNGNEVPSEYKHLIPNFEQTLVKFKSASSIQNLYKYPNFQYGCLNPPSGWVGTMPASSLFNQYPFLYEKYRTITAIKLNIDQSFFEGDRLKQNEHIVRNCFPEKSNMTIMDTRSTGFSPGIGERGCLITLCESKIHIEEKNELKYMYFLVCHSSFPDNVLDDIQQHELNLHRTCDDYANRHGNVRKEYLEKAAKPRTLADEFDEDGPQHHIMQTAQELSVRNLIHYMDLTGMKPTRQITVMDVDEDETLRCPDEALHQASPALLDKALKWWPQTAIMGPFSKIPAFPHIDKDLQDFHIGHAVSTMLKIDKDFCKKHSRRFDDTIYTIDPQVQTTYNTARVAAGQLYNYNNCAPINTTLLAGKPFIVEKGLEVGYEIYNYDPITDKPLESGIVKNDSGHGFPVVYPFKPDNKQVKPEVVRKFFSREAGGFEMNHIVPEQLKGHHQVIKFPTQRLLPIKNTAPVILTPIQTFLSPLPPPAPIYTYDN